MAKTGVRPTHEVKPLGIGRPMLEKLFVGQRSGVSPLLGSVCSQNQLNVRRSSVSRNAVWREVSADGGIGPLIPVIDVALVHADAIKTKATKDRRRINR